VGQLRESSPKISWIIFRRSSVGNPNEKNNRELYCASSKEPYNIFRDNQENPDNNHRFFMMEVTSVETSKRIVRRNSPSGFLKETGPENLQEEFPEMFSQGFLRYSGGKCVQSWNHLRNVQEK
jgi:hypothetical protein